MATPEFQFTDGTTLPVGTMYCIGRNYAAHAREMGADVPTAPLVFIKPPTAYVPDGGSIVIPSYSSNLHHEVELVVIIGADAENVNTVDALFYVAGYAVGIDATLRDVQAEAKKKGEPWSVAKSFRTSAPVSVCVPAREVTADEPLELLLTVNGELRQHGFTSHMERSVAELVAYCSSVFGLRRGDCIFTGTPEGVSQVHQGDTLHAELVGKTSLTVSIA